MRYDAGRTYLFLDESGIKLCENYNNYQRYLKTTNEFVNYANLHKIQEPQE